VFTTSEHILVICDTDKYQPSHGGDHKTFEVMTST